MKRSNQNKQNTINFHLTQVYRSSLIPSICWQKSANANNRVLGATNPISQWAAGEGSTTIHNSQGERVVLC